MPILEKARDDLAKLFEAYIEATGASPSTVSLSVAKDSKFMSRLSGLDMRLSTVDAVIHKFAAIWPVNLKWPEGVARPEIDEADRFVGPLGRRSAHDRAWPADLPWPSDVPRPASHQPA